MPKKGHILKLTDKQGVFCVKCGKMTSRLKHQRLKILNKPCKYPNLPESQWLQKPGAARSQVRISELLNELHNNHNSGGHVLVWNEQAGKYRNQGDKYGSLWCSQCNKQWPWTSRYHCLKYPCVPAPEPITPPTWVEQLKNSQTVQSLTPVISKPSGRKRIHGKQAVPAASSSQSPNPNYQPVVHAVNSQASGSMQFPRAGVG